MERAVICVCVNESFFVFLNQSHSLDVIYIDYILSSSCSVVIFKRNACIRRNARLFGKT